MKKFMFLFLTLITLSACSWNTEVGPTSYSIGTSFGPTTNGSIDLGIRVGVSWWFEEKMDITVLNELQVIYINDGIETDFGTIPLPENKEIPLKANTEYQLNLDLTQFFTDELPSDGEFRVIFNILVNGTEMQAEIDFPISGSIYWS